MIVRSDRFGAVEIDEKDTLRFPTGIVGFPDESLFVLLRRQDSRYVGWLQSAKSSHLTLPVVSAHALNPKFPDVDLSEHLARAGLGSHTEEVAILAVLAAPPNEPATVNLMAPIIVNARTRVGAQVMLEGTHFSTHEAFILARDRLDNQDDSASVESDES
jgi:flagellar assembly factor FliW